MHSFVDNSRRTWEIAINVAAVKRIRGLLGIDLYALVDDGFKSLSKLVSDPVTLADVLYCLCKDQAERQSITDEDFGRALAGDVITQAADAFVEELIDFFPDARARGSLRKAIEAGKAVREKVLNHAEKILDAINPETEAQKWINSSGTWPASSASTQDHLPSES
jgi:regulator of extracellular matrix RemA (YlzA/DUF370 family)